jgi:mannitol/fructose-specific phosphotransferase system IIA component (Ntr-type)
MDGKPSRIFVLILSPKDQPGEYLQFVAGLSKSLSDAQKREELISARNNSTLHARLAGS